MSLIQSETECAANLNNLPDDVLLSILRFCDIRSLSVLSRVSRNLYRLARDDSVWRRIALRCVNVHPSDRKCGWNWKELCRVSWNWTHGYCKDRSLVKFKCNLMPWIQLGRSQQLYIAKAADIVLYQSSKHNKGQSPWQPVKTFSGHHGDVSKFVISGGQLVTCSMDNSVRTWNLQTGKCDGLCLGHEGDVHSVDCFDDVIVTGSRDKTIKVWSQQSTTCVHTIHVQDNVWSVCLNPSTMSVVSGGSGHTRGVSPLQLWDIDSGRLITSLVSGVNRLGAGVRGIKWETPHTLLSCGYDTNVRLWDIRRNNHNTSSCVLKWEDPHDSVVYCVDSDNKWMVISGTNRYGVVRIWDKRFRKCVRMYYAGRNSFSPVYSLSFNRTSLFVALASGVRILDFTVSVVSGGSGHTRGVSPLQLWDIDRLSSSLVSGVSRLGAEVRGIEWETPRTLLSCGYDTNVRLWGIRLNNHNRGGVLDTIETGVQAIHQSEDQLLPVIHRVWPPMVKRFMDDERVITHVLPFYSRLLCLS